MDLEDEGGGRVESDEQVEGGGQWVRRRPDFHDDGDEGAGEAVEGDLGDRRWSQKASVKADGERRKGRRWPGWMVRGGGAEVAKEGVAR